MSGGVSRAARAAEVERLLRTSAGGEAREIVSESGQQAYARLFAEKSSSERYSMQMQAFNAAPSIYMLRTYLRMVASSMGDIKKYVIAMRDPTRVVYEVDLKPPAAVDILGAEISAMENKTEKSE